MEHEPETLLDPVRESLTERWFGLSTAKFLIALGSVLVAGIYMGLLFFGDSSLSVLLDLNAHQDNLAQNIERLKTENAALQKQYFELLELDADAQ